MPDHPDAVPVLNQDLDLRADVAKIQPRGQVLGMIDARKSRSPAKVPQTLRGHFVAGMMARAMCRLERRLCFISGFAS